MLAKLPKIVDGEQVDEAYLAKAGVPDTEVAAVAKSALEAFRSAKNLREKQTESMRFDLDQRVEIAPLDEPQIESIMREFKRQLPSQVPPDAAEFLVSRLALQLQEIFCTKIWVTLKYSDFVDSKSQAHLPKELLGLYFQIEFLPDGKHPHPLHVSAIPGKNSPYFFLKVPSGVTNEEKGIR